MDIVVWGRRAPEAFFHFSFLEPPFLSPDPFISPDPVGPGPNQVSEPYTAQCPTEDASARHIADRIRTLPSSNNVEWGASIIRTSEGKFTSGSAAIGSDLMPRGNTLWVAATEYGSLVGHVHNHPNSVPNANALQDRYPSNTDWDSVELLKANGSSYGFDAMQFAIYIIDHDGNVRKFPYAQRDMFPRNADTELKNQGVALPPVIGQATGCTEAQ